MFLTGFDYVFVRNANTYSDKNRIDTKCIFYCEDIHSHSYVFYICCFEHCLSFFFPLITVVVSSRFENNHLKENIFLYAYRSWLFFYVCLSDNSVGVINVQELSICHGNRAAPVEGSE